MNVWFILITTKIKNLDQEFFGKSRSLNETHTINQSELKNSNSKRHHQMFGINYGLVPKTFGKTK
jgi:hypothetical protein